MQAVQITAHFPSMIVGVVVGSLLTFVGLVISGIRMKAKKEITDKSA